MGGWTVLVSDGLARCSPTGSDETRRSLAEGWTALDGGHDTRMAGWTRAVVELGHIPEDYDDDMRPGLIWGPTTLYRSVSPAELLDIAETGKVTGAGNSFNGHDRRPFVFFSASMSDACLGQGEDVERAAFASLRGHPLHAELARIPGREAALVAAAMPEARRQLEALDRDRVAKGRQPMTPDDADWGEFAHVNSELFKIAMWRFDGRAALMADLAALGREAQALLATHSDLLREAVATLRADRAEGAVTSAVLRTVPISVGFHYSAEHGRTGMNGEDEYGLFPGQVTVADIVEVTLVRDGVPGETVSLDEAAEAVRGGRAPAPR